MHITCSHQSLDERHAGYDLDTPWRLAIARPRAAGCWSNCNSCSRCRTRHSQNTRSICMSTAQTNLRTIRAVFYLQDVVFQLSGFAPFCTILFKCQAGYRYVMQLVSRHVPTNHDPTRRRTQKMYKSLICHNSSRYCTACSFPLHVYKSYSSRLNYHPSQAGCFLNNWQCE